MNDDLRSTRYVQLNERSRWYTSQLWYVPFAYLGLVGLGLKEILALDPLPKLFALTVLGMLSLAIFVQVCSGKYFERRAVQTMKDMEDKKKEGYF